MTYLAKISNIFFRALLMIIFAFLTAALQIIRIYTVASWANFEFCKENWPQEKCVPEIPYKKKDLKLQLKTTVSLITEYEEAFTIVKCICMEPNLFSGDIFPSFLFLNNISMDLS